MTTPTVAEQFAAFFEQYLTPRDLFAQQTDDTEETDA